MTPNIETEKPPAKESVQELIAKLNPDLRAAIESLKATLEKTGFRQEVDALKAKILKKPVRPEQQFFSFLPHQLAKTSIFFPMSDRELKEESRIISRLEHETNWGKVIIEGVKLAIYEEDILLALLYLLKDNLSKLKEDASIETNLNKLVNILYGVHGYSKRNEDVILRTLDRFGHVCFHLIVGDWQKKGKERLRVETKTTINSILSACHYDSATKNLKIHFNPYFLAFFLESMLTTISLSLRRRLKKDGSKALLRFLEAHTDPGKMHILTVLNAINYNTNQPMHTLRKRIKAFIAELKKHGVLSNKSRLFNDDMVHLAIQSPKKHLPV